MCARDDMLPSVSSDRCCSHTCISFPALLFPGLLTGLTRFYYQMIPNLVTASVLSVYAVTRTSEHMSAATVFTAISLFGIMVSEGACVRREGEAAE